MGEEMDLDISIVARIGRPLGTGENREGENSEITRNEALGRIILLKFHCPKSVLVRIKELGPVQVD